jgi:hypothetical protein
MKPKPKPKKKPKLPYYLGDDPSQKNQDRSVDEAVCKITIKVNVQEGAVWLPQS